MGVLFLVTGLTASADFVAPVQKLVTSPRIVGGMPSTRDQWPWVMALVFTGTESLYARQFCAGTLIAPNWVVTAGHCVAGMGAKSFNVVAGVYDLLSDTGQEIQVKRIIRHPGYSHRTSKNDIALLQLKTPVTYPAAAVLHVYTGDSDLTNETAVIIGWGTLHEGPYRPITLYDAALPIVSNADCKLAYPNDNIAKKQLCAGFAQGGVDTCQGDSGGPLVVQQNAQWMLAGITSYGDGCARPGFYGVYTRVSSYVQFIKSKLKLDFVP